MNLHLRLHFRCCLAMPVDFFHTRSSIVYRLLIELRGQNLGKYYIEYKPKLLCSRSDGSLTIKLSRESPIHRFDADRASSSPTWLFNSFCIYLELEFKVFRWNEQTRYISYKQPVFLSIQNFESFIYTYCYQLKIEKNNNFALD